MILQIALISPYQHRYMCLSVWVYGGGSETEAYCEDVCSVLKGVMVGVLEGRLQKLVWGPVGVGSSWARRFFALRQYHRSREKTTRRVATPPITPPTIAPVGALLDSDVKSGDKVLDVVSVGFAINVGDLLFVSVGVSLCTVEAPLELVTLPCCPPGVSIVFVCVSVSAVLVGEVTAGVFGVLDIVAIDVSITVVGCGEGLLVGIY